MQLLQLLWRESPLGATDIADRLPSDRQWSLTTVKTLLSRLVAKGALTTEQGRRFLYCPAVAQDEVAGRQANSLIEQLFGGRVSRWWPSLPSSGISTPWTSRRA
jgi:predicted transcriptional regulator